MLVFKIINGPKSSGHLQSCLTGGEIHFQGALGQLIKPRPDPVKVKVKSLSPVRLFATSWAVACTRLLHPWDFLGKSTGVGCHFLLQGIFPSQGSNPGLPHCRQMLYHLSHQGSPGRVIQILLLRSTLLPPTAWFGSKPLGGSRSHL